MVKDNEILYNKYTIIKHKVDNAIESEALKYQNQIKDLTVYNY